jgi:hypothetical protein
MNIYLNPNRAKIERVREWVADNLKQMKAAVTTQTLIFSAIVTKNQSHVEFFLTGDNKFRDGENRLDKNDLFFINDMALMVSKEGKGQEGNRLLLSYPDPHIFDDEDSTKAHIEEWRALMTAYNGYLSLEDNVGKMFTRFPTSEFLHIPQLQYTPETTTTKAILPSLEKDKYFVPFEPNIILSGQSSSKFILNLGQGDRELIGGTDSSMENVLHIVCKGTLVPELATTYTSWAKK